MAGGRIARIFIGETVGVVLDDNTAESIMANLSRIDELDTSKFHEPSTLDAETTIIAKALGDVH